MTETGYLFLGLNAIVAALVGVLAFAASKFVIAARGLGKQRAAGTETAFMAAAMEQALERLRSQERAMKQRAEASEWLSQQIVASLTSGLLVVDAERRVQTLNPAGRRMLGLPDGLQPQQVGDLLRTVPPLRAVVEECMSTGRPVLRRTVQLVQPGGTVVHLGVSASPMRDDEARTNGVICLFTDLSAVVELEEQLRLKDSLARLGELTAGLAHEFRNGLATIHGYSRLLDLERVPADFKPYVTGIRAETEALREVVTNFLNFARPAELTLSPVPLRGLAERAADEIRGEVSGRGGVVTVAGDFATVMGDEILLRQALSNLCRNALEACVDGGRLPRIAIEGAVDHGQRVQQLTVTDSGPGVDANVTARMFRPFFTTKKTGTGLGLALVQKIIVTHNGRVTAVNAPEGGARIIVTLPLPAEHA